MKRNQKWFGLAALAAGIVLATGAQAQDPIKIGEINSYTALADFTQPYKKGWEMAVEEINAAGGVLGRPLQVIARDDGGKPGNAVKIAEELVTKEKVDFLAGTFFLVTSSPLICHASSSPILESSSCHRHVDDFSADGPTLFPQIGIVTLAEGSRSLDRSGTMWFEEAPCHGSFAEMALANYPGLALE